MICWLVGHVRPLQQVLAVQSLPMFKVPQPARDPPTTQTNLKFSCWKDILGWQYVQGSFKWVWGGSTTLNLCESVESRRTAKVEGGSTTPNLCESLESRPTGQVWVSSEWFVNTKPPRTTLLQGEAGLQGSFVWVLCGLTTSNLLEPLWWRVKKAYS